MLFTGTDWTHCQRSAPGNGLAHPPADERRFQSLDRENAHCDIISSSTVASFGAGFQKRRFVDTPIYELNEETAYAALITPSL
ncbi:hypothetical protein [Reticulibacter mediterranei]|uniref:hypothetical protein n=1 Tax=Reticulibacter mediterranei TaxID=2778369 RepID=UPI001C68B3E2|nr:hypothetical protein [Reticulibacter mediterranei]